jgi:hypothetical protein
MRFEWILLIGSGLIMANIYTDGKLLKNVLSYKKYYQMAGVAIGALVLYWLFKKNPVHAQNILYHSNEYLKYMPIDRNTTNMLNPILDFTNKFASSNSGDGYAPIVNMPSSQNSYAESRVMSSGLPTASDVPKPTKRSVSETKKKYVAAQQNWHCGDCQRQLPAWFEVDHKIRLEYGGSNHIDNLVALCRDCHGKKTAIENL